MKLIYETLTRPVVLWEDAQVGEVYQSTDTDLLLAIRAGNDQGLCIRSGEGVELHSIWTPGPRSKWYHVPAVMTLPEEAA